MDDNRKRMSQYDPMSPWAVTARKYAEEAGDPDPEGFARQMYAESRFNVDAVSSAGARGIAQFMPDTAKQYGVDVNDPHSSLKGALRYRKWLRDHFAKKGVGGGESTVLAGYNAGPGNVLKYRGIPPFKETMNYVHDITGAASVPSAYSAPASPIPQPSVMLPVEAQRPEGSDMHVTYSPYRQPEGFTADMSVSAMPASFDSFTTNYKNAILGSLYGGNSTR